MTKNSSYLPQPVPTILPSKITMELAHTSMQICISANCGVSKKNKCITHNTPGMLKNKIRKNPLLNYVK